LPAIRQDQAFYAGQSSMLQREFRLIGQPESLARLRHKAADQCLSGRFGSGKWTRTTDPRIMIPVL
jgi:hypothetical protein